MYRWTFSLCLLTLLPILQGHAQEPQAITAPFPERSLIPAEETGALRFLAEHPESDGRGVVVAIFDTGVDPGAAGLQTTPDGKPKIVDMIDGTGSGDVPTEKVVKAKDGKLTGLTGRTLTLSPEWKNPSGDYHLGWKRGYELFSEGVVQRVREERREDFEKQHLQLVDALRREIQDWKAKHPKPTTDEKKQLQELESRLEELKDAWDKYEDPGPIYDCIVFSEGTHWRAVVDTDEDGDLAEEKVLTNYRIEKQYATFGAGILVNFAVNIYDNGDMLSIVTDSGDHGTHVAGIVGAYFPDSPASNGVAPGVQLVSVKIGDTRLGGMETGAGLIRGLSAVLENKCDLVNMSYGEPSFSPDQGRLVELFNELVREHGVIFVASAGNAGPALTTVGAPGGTTSGLISVGAYVSPEMMAAQYAMLPLNEGLPYNWTSRGPTTDGELGVTIFAPGGAVAPVPTSSLRSRTQMNGTSMASPNACGNLALILSGLKVRETKYTPWSVRRAIVNTAKFMPQIDLFAQGPGLIQTDQAYDYLLNATRDPAELMEFSVRFPARDDARGLSIRSGQELPEVARFEVAVEPRFPEAIPNETKLAFQTRIRLESTAPWVKVAGHMLLNSEQEWFDLEIDRTQLKPGLNVASVNGYLADYSQRGAIFRVPITIILPEQPEAKFETEITLEPGRNERFFLDVPAGATWMDVTLTKAPKPNQPASLRYVIHTVQVLPGQTAEKGANLRYLNLTDDQPQTLAVSVEDRHTIELCIGQYWSEAGASQVSCQVEFHSLKPEANPLVIEPGAPVTSLRVTNALPHAEQIEPESSLKIHRTLLRPDESQVTLLTEERDRIISGEIASELVLTYEFEQTRKCEVTFRLPENDDLLYDSLFGTQLSLLFDENGRHIATDDVFPEGHLLEKGKYTFKLHLTHTDPKMLEELKDAVVYLDRPLKKGISLSVRRTRQEAMRKEGNFGSLILPGQRDVMLWINPPSASEYSEASAGDLLLGEMTLGKSPRLQGGSGQRPNPYPVIFIVPPAAAEESEESAPSKKEETVPEKLSRELYEFRLKQLKSIPSEQDELFETMYAELLKDHPEDLALLETRLQRYDAVERRKDHLPKIVQATDDILAKIDTDELANYFGRKHDPQSPEEKQLAQTMEKQKATLLDVLYRKGRALGYMELPEVIEQHPIEDPKAHDKAFEANFAELKKWADTTEKTYHLLHVRRERRKGNYGAALHLLNEHSTNAPPDYWHAEKRADLYELLGWKVWEEYERKWIKIRFPNESGDE